MKVCELAPTSDTRKCDKCGTYTWWARPKQRLHGMCLTCAGAQAVTLEEYMMTIDYVLGYFGADVISPPRPTPVELGPCARCGAHCRTYGAYAMSTLCPSCRRSW